MIKTWKISLSVDSGVDTYAEEIISAESREQAEAYAIREACDRWIEIDVVPVSEDAKIQDIAERATKSVNDIVKLVGNHEGVYGASNFSAALHTWMTDYFNQKGE